jgi:hypothetical protein
MPTTKKKPKKTKHKTRSQGPPPPSIEYVEYPPGEYEVHAWKIKPRKTTEVLSLGGGEKTRTYLTVYPTVRNFDQHFTVTVQWRLVDPHNHVRFIDNTTTDEPLRNLIPPNGTIDIDQIIGRANRVDQHNSWKVINGNASGRKTPSQNTLNKLIEENSSINHVGTPQTHTHEFWCALNAYSNGAHLPDHLHAELKSKVGATTSLQELAGEVQQISGLQRMEQAAGCGRSVNEKLRWLLDMTDRGGTPTDYYEGRHTGVYLFAVWGHVVAWDTRAKLIYDPDPQVAVALPAILSTTQILQYGGPGAIGKLYSLITPRKMNSKKEAEKKKRKRERSEKKKERKKKK